MALKPKKQLFRSKKLRTVCGVLGGFSEAFEIDVVLLRALYILVTAFTGFAPGIVAYLLLCFIMPQE